MPFGFRFWIRTSRRGYLNMKFKMCAFFLFESHDEKSPMSTQNWASNWRSIDNQFASTINYEVGIDCQMTIIWNPHTFPIVEGSKCLKAEQTNPNLSLFERPYKVLIGRPNLAKLWIDFSHTKLFGKSVYIASVHKVLTLLAAVWLFYRYKQVVCIFFPIIFTDSFGRPNLSNFYK